MLWVGGWGCSDGSMKNKKVKCSPNTSVRNMNVISTIHKHQHLVERQNEWPTLPFLTGSSASWKHQQQEIDVCSNTPAYTVWLLVRRGCLGVPCTFGAISDCSLVFILMRTFNMKHFAFDVQNEIPPASIKRLGDNKDVWTMWCSSWWQMFPLNEIRIFKMLILKSTDWQSATCRSCFQHRKSKLACLNTI